MNNSYYIFLVYVTGIYKIANDLGILGFLFVNSKPKEYCYICKDAKVLYEIVTFMQIDEQIEVLMNVPYTLKNFDRM